MRKLIKPMLLFVVMLAFDQVSKWLAVDSLTTWQNQGIMFGLYSELPTIHRGVFLATLFGLLFSAQVLLLYFIPTHWRWPRAGLPILFGGMGSNVVDRLWHGHSIDFIPIPFLDNGLIVFNLADAFQWLGAGLLVKALMDYHKLPDSKRQTILIMPKEQLYAAKHYLLISLCTSLVFTPFGISYLRAGLHAPSTSPLLWNQMLSTYLLGSFFLALTCSIGSLLVGLILTHRSAGALFAFERHVRQLLQGEEQSGLNLRADDRYRHLIELARDLKEHINRKAG